MGKNSKLFHQETMVPLWSSGLRVTLGRLISQKFDDLGSGAKKAAGC
jgi:hypothetical protein